MNRDFDELVHDSMTWFTDGVEAPASLADQARQRRRKHRHARVGWLTAGVVLASAATAASLTTAGLSTAAGPGPAGHSTAAPVTRHAQTAAMVISRIDNALTRAATGHPVAYTRQTTRGVSIDVLVPSGRPLSLADGTMSTWSRGALQHVEFTTRQGKLALGEYVTTTSGKSVQTWISYQRRVWWGGTYQAPAPAPPQVACTIGAMQRTAAQWAREVRKLLSCGATIAGHQRVDGVQTIKFGLGSSYHRACAAATGTRHCRPEPVGWNGFLWASASTYLPVRLLASGSHYGFQLDFRWLTPTAANLALLHRVIPSGFRHV